MTSSGHMRFVIARLCCIRFHLRRWLVLEARDMHLDLRCCLLRARLQGTSRCGQLLRDCDKGVPNVPNLQYASCVRAWTGGSHSTNCFSRAGILPSNKTTYTLANITNALYSQTGAIPYLGCVNNGTVLDEVWYLNHVLGSVSTLASGDRTDSMLQRSTQEQYGRFKPVNSTTPSSCNEDGVWYYERTPGSERRVAY